MVAPAVMRRPWSRFETVLVRITTADGLYGWGECFAYGCQAAVAEAFRTIAPLLIGQDAAEIEPLMRRVQHKLHLFGRYGITMFAISGADMALWDRRGKAEGRALASLLGASPRREAVASYRSVKLHETVPEMIHAGRRGAGTGVHLTVDANCAWSLEEATALLPEFEAAELSWLEEPLFPPKTSTP